MKKLARWFSLRYTTAFAVFFAACLMGVAIPNPVSAAGVNFKRLVNSANAEVDTASPNREINEFGSSLFSNIGSSVLSNPVASVGLDYILGPGDELQLMTWGTIDVSGNFVIDRDGVVTLPKFGPLSLNGVSLGEAQKLLKNTLAKYYKGFEISVALGSMRSFPVYVVGDSANPGAYQVNAATSLLNLFLQSGGPTLNGSVRDIQLKRRGAIVAHFDLYDWLISGDRSNDIRLQPDDVVFIPPSGPKVAVLGAVKRPGIYELPGSVSLSEVIRLSGGLDDVAYKGRVQIQSVTNHMTIEGKDVSLETARSLPVNGGDVISFFSVIQTPETIYLGGEFARVGPYHYVPGANFSYYFDLAGGPTPLASREVEIMRVIPTPTGPNESRIRLSLDEVKLLIPEPRDVVTLRMIPEWKPKRTVRLSGEVKLPGEYTITNGERLASVIQRAGGFTSSAFVKGAVFLRESVRVKQQHTNADAARRFRDENTQLSASADIALKTAKIADSLESAAASGRIIISISGENMSQDDPNNIILEAGDSLTIPPISNTVQVIGAVYNPGVFVCAGGEITIDQWVEKAGGYDPDANRSRVYVIKGDGSSCRRDTVKIEPGDSIVVPRLVVRDDWFKSALDVAQLIYNILLPSSILINALK